MKTELRRNKNVMMELKSDFEKNEKQSKDDLRRERKKVTVERKKMIGDEVFIVAKTASGGGVISIQNDSSSKRRIELCTVTDYLRPYPTHSFFNAFVTRHSRLHHLLKRRL